MVGTIWAFVPAVIAIILALVTKQVYVSLFLGIFVGAMMYSGGDILKAMFTLFQVMSERNVRYAWFASCAPERINFYNRNGLEVFRKKSVLVKKI